MSRHILKGDPPVEVILKRSSRARRISLRVSSIDGRVTLTFPPGVREAEALSFAEEKANWLRVHLDRRQPDVLVEPGVAIPFRGEMLRVVSGAGRGVRVHNSEIVASGDAACVAPRIQGFLKETARARLVEASDRYADALGLRYSRLSLRDTRSRWGSCSSNGGLMYSWRLILAPDEVLNYVAAHEVAHLAEMNHSTQFWAHVKALYGNYEPSRRWLREHGAGLHRYRF
ncbi:M48 family metallopeptidase [Rhodobacteraceae bacterium LMO-12]|nr:M48 family metallopeptidase [Rhodobacteraceae bacterium LMO-JJ12]